MERLEAEALWIASLNRTDWVLRPRISWGLERNRRLAFGTCSRVPRSACSASSTTATECTQNFDTTSSLSSGFADFQTVFRHVNSILAPPRKPIAHRSARRAGR